MRRSPRPASKPEDPVSERARQRDWPKRFLYFCGRSAWPPDTGAKLRNWHLPHAAARHAEVTFLSFEDDFTDYRGAAALRSKSDFCAPLSRVVTLTRDRPYSIDKLVKSMTGDLPIAVLNYTTRAMAQTVKRLVDEVGYDAVQIEGVHLGAYLPIFKQAKKRPVLVCDWHNIESEVQRRYAENTPHLARGLAARVLAAKLARYEKTFLREFDAHIAVSERDRRELLAIDPSARVHVVENGVDTRLFEGVGAKPVAKDSLVFVGSMDYHANADAAREFAHKAWPLIRAARPDLRFVIVGRNPTGEVKALASLPGVEVAGSVPDVRPYYERAAAAVVPLRIGGGSRLKILEAMAAEVPVVSTRLGAEGLPTRDDVELLLADSVEGLVEPVLAVTRDRERAARLTRAGRALVLSRYDWSAVGEAMMDLYEELGRERRGRAVEAHP
jgi:sugar transferase (PEP-CTERM/EpsH1 system associated)